MAKKKPARIAPKVPRPGGERKQSVEDDAFISGIQRKRKVIEADIRAIAGNKPRPKNRPSSLLQGLSRQAKTVGTTSSLRALNTIIKDTLTKDDKKAKRK